MFLGVVVPLKAKSVCRSWEMTCRSLQATISSLRNQSDGDFVVIVAGHDKPDFLNSLVDERIIFKHVDFSEPTTENGSYPPKNLIDDKILKIISGIKFLSHYRPKYVFQLDSDDLVHSDFITLLKKSSPFDFMTLDGGYFLYQNCNRYIESDNMNQYCGSTVVINSHYLSFPDSIDLESRLQIPWTKYRHMNIHKFYADTPGIKYSHLSDKMVAYVVGSGENLSDRWRDSVVKKIKWHLKPYLTGKRVTRDFAKKFGL